MAKRTIKTTARKAIKAVTSLIPSKYIPAQVRRDPKTGKLKLKISSGKLKRSTRTRKATRKRKR